MKIFSNNYFKEKKNAEDGGLQRQQQVGLIGLLVGLGQYRLGCRPLLICHTLPQALLVLEALCVLSYSSIGHGSLTLNLLCNHNNFENKYYFLGQNADSVHLNVSKAHFWFTPFTASRSLGSRVIGLSGLLCKVFHISCSALQNKTENEKFNLD